MVSNHTKSHISLLLVQLFFAINYTAIKYLIANGFAGPFAINLLRALVATILLWILFAFKKNKDRVAKKDIGRFLLCALVGIALNQMLFIKGLSYTSTIHASLLILITPILITLLAAWFLKESLTVAKVLGLLSGISGAALLITSGSSTKDAPNMLLGDLLVLLNAIFYTFYFILVKPLMEKYSPVTIIRLSFTLGLLMMLPFCLQEFSQIKWQLFNNGAFLSIASITLLGTFAAYLMNIFGIKYLGAGTAGAYIYVQPLFASVIAMIVMGEELSWLKVIAALLIGLGVFLTHGKKPAPASQEKLQTGS